MLPPALLTEFIIGTLNFLPAALLSRETHVTPTTHCWSSSVTLVTYMLISLPVPGIASMTRGQSPHCRMGGRDTPTCCSSSTSPGMSWTPHLLVSKESHGSPPTLMTSDHMTSSCHIKQLAYPLAVCFMEGWQPTTRV